MNVLDKIIRHKKEELKNTKSVTPLSELKARIKDTESVRSFKSAVKRTPDHPINLIAELKKASPSKGVLRENFDLPEILSVYDKKRVAAISVLTEKNFFSGSLAFLNEARVRTEKPLLRKDFIFDDYQIYETRVNSADAVLLIAAALEKSQLVDLYGLAKEFSLDCLVEVHNLKEIDAALYCGAEIIGINNRNLTTLNISLNISFNLLKDIPHNIIVVSESGIHTRTDVEAIEATRADAVLVGTAIMEAEDMGAKIDELMH